ncbi:uncharacterized protein LOC141800460 [Halichoeres trimaculatus]|uniref:uncharacterized protein LOC141800460 n=1 Tax=Halichoeres trimaculatus TaxID=147232 RepID=UPI003D9E5572
MQLIGLTEVTLILTLTFVSESLGNEEWTIKVDRTFHVPRGSDLTIPCRFDCPSCDGKVSVFWKRRIGNNSDGNDNKKNEFVYHENESLVMDRYRHKTGLVKDAKDVKNCTLRIQNVTLSDENIYVRLETEKNKYSFFKKTVSIFVSEIPISETSTPTPEAGTKKNNQNNSSAILYTAIFVPVSALMIIVILVGTFCFIKQRRKQSFTREDSGYYANFSRPSSNNAKSEVSSKKIDNLPEMNDVEDPVYVNVKDPVDRMDQNIDNTNNIYANVNYSR